jgi:hypothetical protein
LILFVCPNDGSIANVPPAGAAGFSGEAGDADWFNTTGAVMICLLLDADFSGFTCKYSPKEWSVSVLINDFGLKIGGICFCLELIRG